LLAAKARAVFAGRVHASIADVRAVATPALRHRIILSFEGEAEGITTDRVLEETLRAVPETA
jgi:MoxR-like ATPase